MTGGRFRKDGQLICVGGDDGSVKIFDVASKTLLRTLRGHDNATHVGEFVTTQNLASFSDDKTVRLWDVSTEDEIQKFNEHKVKFDCLTELQEFFKLFPLFCRTMFVQGVSLLHQLICWCLDHMIILSKFGTGVSPKLPYIHLYMGTQLRHCLCCPTAPCWSQLAGA